MSARFIPTLPGNSHFSPRHPMNFRRHALAAVASAAVLATMACGSDDSTTAVVVVNPVIGVSATAKSISSVLISFNSTAGDASYDIERAEGATGTFANVTNVPAPAVAGPVTFTDNNLKVNTLYRYRVFTNKGGSRS